MELPGKVNLAAVEPAVIEVRAAAVIAVPGACSESSVITKPKAMT